MSYCYEVHSTVKQIIKRRKALHGEIELLAAELTPSELETAIHLITALTNERTIDRMIDCSGFATDDFCRTFDISPDTLLRWRVEGLTDFELEALIFYIVQFEIEEDRAIEKNFLSVKKALLEDR